MGSEMCIRDRCIFEDQESPCTIKREKWRKGRNHKTCHTTNYLIKILNKSFAKTKFILTNSQTHSRRFNRNKIRLTFSSVPKSGMAVKATLAAGIEPEDWANFFCVHEVPKQGSNSRLKASKPLPLSLHFLLCFLSGFNTPLFGLFTGFKNPLFTMIGRVFLGFFLNTVSARPLRASKRPRSASERHDCYTIVGFANANSKFFTPSRSGWKRNCKKQPIETTKKGKKERLRALRARNFKHIKSQMRRGCPKLPTNVTRHPQ